MTAAQVIGIDLIALGLLVAYWEWRYRTHEWGRGWMHEPKHRLGMNEWVSLFPSPFDDDIDLSLPPR